ncbi:MAG: DHH family phosphoesterase [Eggerthellaceae bacterium]|nr:DHH family phosphoesterase [Eggerthellaceae bacterium]
MLALPTNIDLARIAQLFRGMDDFVLCGHVNPDGDCIGSQLALSHALRAAGKRTTCLLAHDAPVDPTLGFLPGIGEMVPAAGFSGKPGAFILCDVSTADRIGEDACAVLARSTYSFTIDHHLADTAMTHYAYIDPGAASTTTIIWELVKRLEVKPTHEMALCAYTGLVTDTGNFMFQNTGPAAFEAAAELVAFGVDPSEVASAVFQSRSLAALRLEGALLSHI